MFILRFNCARMSRVSDNVPFRTYRTVVSLLTHCYYEYTVRMSAGGREVVARTNECGTAGREFTKYGGRRTRGYRSHIHTLSNVRCYYVCETFDFGYGGHETTGQYSSRVFVHAIDINSAL